MSYPNTVGPAVQGIMNNVNTARNTIGSVANNLNTIGNVPNQFGAMRNTLPNMPNTYSMPNLPNLSPLPPNFNRPSYPPMGVIPNMGNPFGGAIDLTNFNATARVVDQNGNPQGPGANYIMPNFFGGVPNFDQSRYPVQAGQQSGYYPSGYLPGGSQLRGSGLYQGGRSNVSRFEDYQKVKRGQYKYNIYSLIDQPWNRLCEVGTCGNFPANQCIAKRQPKLDWL